MPHPEFGWKVECRANVTRVPLFLVGETPRYDGWTFVAALQHLDGDNVVRSLPGEIAPETYRDRETDHAHALQPRGDRDMSAKRSRRPPLTLRLLRGMADACNLIAAGGPADLTGYEDDDSQKRFDDVCDAAEWLNTEVSRREEKRDLRSRALADLASRSVHTDE